MPDTPSSLRQKFRALRNQLSSKQQTDHANKLANHVCSTQAFVNCQRLACYLPNDGEIDPTEIIRLAWKQDKEVYLPVLDPLDNHLNFVAYTSESELRENKFGIPEPTRQEKNRLTARELDLILLPLVAFDMQGNRLGMGGGFYDRSLAFKQEAGHAGKPFLLGLAHGIQQADSLQSQHWDIPLDAIATEKGFYSFK